ncbi:MAG: hypothetical protein COB20_06260 [SAR86 cluster bacterium]|uniref:Lipoprotein n=1 Tax=SAR86 cluster bacterium TaxID=2030880 RepID=A0A2A4X809_9GAMM|nr:hypothetical protein [Sneathiella sp.]PCI78802.1 MAG: hypothetical protein COB20_06260 [SAR86 cluster bacterium]
MKKFDRKWLALLALLFVTACSATGGPGNPLTRPFQYFSYLNGDDIRNNCSVGGPSKYRLVFNALYEQQVRAYDISQEFKADTGLQKTRVFSRGIGSEIDVSTKGLDFVSNLKSDEMIDMDTLISIDNALISVGFEQPAKEGLVLHSDEFYWIAMVCRDGNFKYYAWTKENADIANLPFIDVLSKADKTGSKVAEVKEPIIHIRGGRPRGGADTDSIGYFSLEVGNNGLKL